MITKRVTNRTYDHNESNRNLRGDYITVVNGSRTARVLIDQIELVEQQGKKLHLITATDDYVCNESMETIARILHNKDFYRVMKKLMINFDRVKEINRSEIIFMSGTSIIIGRNNFLETKHAFKAYMLKYPPCCFWEPAPVLAEDDVLESLSK